MTMGLAQEAAFSVKVHCLWQGLIWPVMPANDKRILMRVHVHMQIWQAHDEYGAWGS